MGETVEAAVLTSTEWRSLLGYGELRIAKRRIQLISLPITRRQASRLFSWSPTTVMGDGNDVVVVELNQTWRETSRRHSSHPAELLVIDLPAISAHHCMGESFLAYLEPDALREGIVLIHGRYDSEWNSWTASQRESLTITSTAELLRTFGLEPDLSKKRPDGYRWIDVLSLADNARTQVRRSPKHIETLLRHVRAISSDVAGVHDSMAYDIVTNAEWVRQRTRRNPYSLNEVQDVLRADIAALQDQAWNASSIDNPVVQRSTELIQRTYPKAYTEELSPFAVAAVIRLVMASKSKKLKPGDLSAVVHELMSRGQIDSAVVVLVVVAGALGPLITRRLAHQYGYDAPSEIDWTVE